MARSKQPQDDNVTEPTAPTVDNSPATETPEAAAPIAPVAPKLQPNQSVTMSGAIRTDN